jgi:ribose 5-phosphate isomerase B
MENETRNRVRDLVREVLAKTPLEEASKPAIIEHFVVNSLKDEIGKEFDRDESAKTILTEDDLRGLDFGARVRVSEGVKFTPLASDIIREREIELIKKTSRHSSSNVSSIAIGCDHGGFETKENLKSFLNELGFRVHDFGTNSTDAVDYPDFALAVAVSVSNSQSDVGIIIDGAGIGSAMTANKVPNVRAAACYSVALAKNSREHNGANVLTLGSGQNNFNELKEIVSAWLNTDITEDRHLKRVVKIVNIEKQYTK